MDNILLHACLDRHLDALISGHEGDIEATLEQCLRESFSSWSGFGSAGPFLSALCDLRSKHPQGMSKRQSRRKTVVDNLVVELGRIWEAQEREWCRGIATHPIVAVVDKLRNIPDEHLDAALDSLLQLPASYPHIHNEQIHEFLHRVHSRLTRIDRVTGPVVIAHIGRLIATGDYPGAGKLIA